MLMVECRQMTHPRSVRWGKNCIKKLQCAQYITASDDLGKKNLQEADFFVIQLYRKKQNGTQQLWDAG